MPDHNNRPLYQQIADALRMQIMEGTLAPSERLPSESTLCKRHGVARSTVRQALQLLTNEGLLARPAHKVGRRSGHYVADIPSHMVYLMGNAEYAHAAPTEDMWSRMIRAAGGTPSEMIWIEQCDATGDVADLLRVPEGTQVLARRRDRFNGTQLHSCVDSLHPYDLVADTPLVSPADIPEGSIKVLQHLGHPIERTIERIVARLAVDGAECRRLGVAAHQPVLESAQISVSRSGVVIEVAYTVFPAGLTMRTFSGPFEA